MVLREVASHGHTVLTADRRHQHRVSSIPFCETIQRPSNFARLQEKEEALLMRLSRLQMNGFKRSDEVKSTIPPLSPAAGALLPPRNLERVSNRHPHILPTRARNTRFKNSREKIQLLIF